MFLFSDSDHATEDLSSVATDGDSLRGPGRSYFIISVDDKCVLEFHECTSVLLKTGNSEQYSYHSFSLSL